MKKAEKAKKFGEILGRLLLKVAQIDDPHITKLESSYRTGLIRVTISKLLEVK